MAAILLAAIFKKLGRCGLGSAITPNKPTVLFNDTAQALMSRFGDCRALRFAGAGYAATDSERRRIFSWPRRSNHHASGPPVQSVHVIIVTHSGHTSDGVALLLLHLTEGFN
jgi:hypothetical protein